MKLKQQLFILLLILGNLCGFLFAGESSGSSSRDSRSMQTSNQHALRLPVLTRNELDFLRRFDGTIDDKDLSIAQAVLNKVPRELLKVRLQTNVAGVDTLIATNNHTQLYGYSRSMPIGFTTWSVPEAKKISEDTTFGYMPLVSASWTGNGLVIVPATMDSFRVTDWSNTLQIDVDPFSARFAGFSENSSHIAVSTGENTIDVFHIADAQKVGHIVVPAPMIRMRAVAIKSSGGLLVCGTHDNTVCVYNSVTQECYDVPQPSAGQPSAEPPSATPLRMQLTHNGQFLSVVFSDNTLCVWHVSNNKLLFKVTANMPISAEVLNLETQSIAYAVGSIISLVKLDAPDRVTTFEGHTAPITQLIFSRAGDELASSSVDGSARIWSVAHGSSTIIAQHANPISGIALCEPQAEMTSSVVDNQLMRMIATASPDEQEVCLWSLDPRIVLLQIRALYVREFITMTQYNRIINLMDQMPSCFKPFFTNWPFLNARIEPEESMMPGTVENIKTFSLAMVASDGTKRRLNASDLQQFASPVLCAQVRWNADQVFDTNGSPQALDALLILARLKNERHKMAQFDKFLPKVQREALILYDKLCCHGLFGGGRRNILECLSNLEARPEFLRSYNGEVSHLPLELQEKPVFYAPSDVTGHQNRFIGHVKQMTFPHAIYSCAVSPDATHVLVASPDSILCRDIITDNQTSVDLPGVNRYSLLAWSSDSKRYAISRVHDNSSLIDIIDAATARVVHTFQLNGLSGAAIIMNLAFCNDDLIIFYKKELIDYGQLVKCHVTPSGLEERQTCVLPLGAASCAINSDKHLVVIGSVTGSITLADLTDVHIFNQHNGPFGGCGTLLAQVRQPITGLGLSNDGSQLVSVSYDGFIRRYWVRFEQLRNRTLSSGRLEARGLLKNYFVNVCPMIFCKNHATSVIISDGRDQIYQWNGQDDPSINPSIGHLAQQDRRGMFYVTFSNHTVSIDCIWPDALTLQQFLLFEKAFKAPKLVDDKQRDLLSRILETMPDELQAIVKRAMPVLDSITDKDELLREKRESSASDGGESSDAPLRKRLEK